VLLDPFNYLDELFAGRTGNLFNHGWCADYPDPANFLDVLYRTGSPQNLGGYSNPAVDALLAEAGVAPEPKSRLGLYADIERLIVADAPAVFLTHSLAAELVKPAVKGYTLTPIGIAQLDRIAVERP
jgi:ABC-type oligopeptide transport system substrate-binding subunit